MIDEFDFHHRANHSYSIDRLEWSRWYTCTDLPPIGRHAGAILMFPSIWWPNEIHMFNTMHIVFCQECEIWNMLHIDWCQQHELKFDQICWCSNKDMRYVTWFTQWIYHQSVCSLSRLFTAVFLQSANWVSAWLQIANSLLAVVEAHAMLFLT